MKYRLKMNSLEMEEVKPKSKMIELIKEKLTPIEFVILVHEIKKELKAELKINKKK